MKKNFILSLSLVLIVFTALTLISTQSSTHPNSPDWGYTAAPTESSCGKSTCHNNTPNSSNGSVSITFDSQYYTPGNTYVVTVSTDETGMSRFGFETCCLDASNNKAGSQSLINTNNTSANTVVNNRWYVGHKSAGATKSWTFNWHAPATDIGNVTFYVASICANNNGNETGDHCYTTSAVFQPESASAVMEVSDNSNFSLIQNPVSDKIMVSYNNSENGIALIRLLDLNGRVIKILLNEEQNSGAHTSTFLTPAISGLYLLEYSNANNRSVKKVIVI